MNQVDLYISNQRLDLFNDEEITINLSVQNLQDISKIFTDFTQGFTIPASTNNNRILSHYYRVDLTGGFDARLRQEARIEINSLPFRSGVIQLEGVQMKGTEPYSYSLSFYGDLVNMTDLFGEDYLYDLDLSAYDHDYNGATIQQGLCTDSLFSGDVMYPLMSPIRDWRWNSHTGAQDVLDIKWENAGGHVHGVNYYELKPAIKVTKLLDAIEAKYGITFSGSFLTTAPFTKLYLWAHRYEGYLYDSSTAIEWKLINFNRSTGGGTEFNLSTDTWNVVLTGFYDLRVTIQNATANYEIGLFQNGVQIGIAREDAHPLSSVLVQFEGYGFDSGDQVQIKIRPQSATSFNYQVTDYTAYDESTMTQRFEVDQSLPASYAFTLAMSPLMPEIKVGDFLSGICKQHNLVIIPSSSTSFTFYSLDDWYAAGSDLDLQQFIDITSTEINRPELFRRIGFKYQQTDQILGYQYRQTNSTGFGDLRADFDFDGEEFSIELPFECPLFERLTDETTGALTDILVYKSVTRETATQSPQIFQPYVGAPILIYGEFPYQPTTSGVLGFIDEAGQDTQCPEFWYANVSSTALGTGLAHSLCWGADIDPYYLTSISNSLYEDYWANYISDLYQSRRRIFNVDAVLPIGKILNLNLNDLVVWNNNKFKINSVSLNLTSGKARFELLNEV